MNDTMHDQLRDRMPEVARGSAVWTADEAAHLAGCAECRDELALITSALRIGTGIEGSFDASAAARAVMHRLKEEPVVAPSRYRPLILLATAAVLALVYARPGTPPSAVPLAADGRIIAELDSLSGEELMLLAEGLDVPLSEAPVGEQGSLTDLDSTQLTRLLRAMEG
ncbi:MAG TPA: hypothetical protein VL295_07845 [Gemmatimonadales bacterium]|nr:hypothetical protein [Gemmatimonadales bacterium]